MREVNEQRSVELRAESIEYANIFTRLLLRAAPGRTMMNVNGERRKTVHAHGGQQW
jgi:hypothetical protein